MTGAKPAQDHSRSRRRARAFAVAGTLLTAAWLVIGTAGLASAQTARLNISVAPAISIEPATQVPFTIQVGPVEAIPRGSFVRVRGLPPMAALSDGHSIAPGAWAVPLSALASLKITVPVGATARSDVSITLVSIDGAVLVEARSAIVVAAEPPRPPAGVLRAGAAIERAAPEQAPLAPAPKLTTEQRDRAQRLVKMGDQQLAEGGVAQARLLYERAADAGLATGAMAMAATYDAAELDRIGAIGIKPDPGAARRWYERARQLGATEADQRLQRLGATDGPQR